MNQLSAQTRAKSNAAGALVAFQITGGGEQPAAVPMHIASDGRIVSPLCRLDAEDALVTDNVDLALIHIKDGGVACPACCVFAEREARADMDDAVDRLWREAYCGATGSLLASYKADANAKRERYEALSAARLAFAGALEDIADRYDPPEAGVASFDPDGDYDAEERGTRAGMEFERVWGQDWDERDLYPDPEPVMPYDY